MELKIGLIIVAIGYCILYFFDSFFKSCAHYPYIKFLEGTGLKINLFNIQWTTTAFNRALLRIGSVRGCSKTLNNWFQAGLILTTLLLPVAILLLVYSFIQSFTSNSNDVILSPVIPGFNLPASEIGYYSLTLVISSVVHEFGHALAAVKEDVQIINVGFNILFILPVAYVNLNSDNFKNLEPKKRLQILTAGVWHNVVLSLICYSMYLASPSILGLAFHSGNGVAVYDAAKSSPLIGAKGLEMGDIITKINDCDVKNEDSWYKCLEVLKMKNGICFHPDLVRELDETVQVKHSSNGFVECCDKSKSGNVCFELLDNEDAGNIQELPNHVCLPARKVLLQTDHYCSKVEQKCSDGAHFCFMPQLNQTNLFKINVRNKGERVVIYMGLVKDFSQTLRVSSFTPKFLRSPVIAESFRKILEYLTVISLGLGLVNVIPCFFMDGQHILNTLLYIFCSRNLTGDKLLLISSITCSIFTILLILHCIFTMMPMIF